MSGIKNFSIICILLLIFSCCGVVFGVSCNPARAEGSEIVYNVKYYSVLDDVVEITVVGNPSTFSSLENSVVLTAYPASPAGYEFSYWGYNHNNELDLDDGGENFVITKEKAQLFAVEENSVKVLKIYAYWIPINYNLNFIYNETAVVDPENFENNKFYTIEDDIDLSLSENQPRKNGYEFLGWFLDSNFSQPINRIYQRYGDLNLYGNFEKLDLVITFAENEYAQIHFDYGQYAYGENGLLTGKDPEKEGYTFAGWYKSSDFNEGSKIGKNYIFTDSTTLYAKFEQNMSPYWWFLVAGIAFVAVLLFVIWYFKFRPDTMSF